MVRPPYDIVSAAYLGLTEGARSRSIRYYPDYYAAFFGGPTA